MLAEVEHTIPCIFDQCRSVWKSLQVLSANFLALTATLTHKAVKSIFECLSMTNVSIIGLPLEGSNIKYSVIPMPSVDDL